MVLNIHSVYSNQGNHSILKFLDTSDRYIMDIGCGAGDTGKLIRSIYPEVHITGITCSQNEHEQAAQNLNCCIRMNVEKDPLPTLADEFDVLIFSHVLEHLVDPVATIQKLLPLLKTDGKVIIALPNIANWRERCKQVLGKFEYTDDGIMDKTHLHFYTFHTANLYLIQTIPELKLKSHVANGSIPLALFRHYFLSKEIKRKIDGLGCAWMPNLFGNEIVIMAVKIRGLNSKRC